MLFQATYVCKYLAIDPCFSGASDEFRDIIGIEAFIGSAVDLLERFVEDERLRFMCLDFVREHLCIEFVQDVVVRIKVVVMDIGGVGQEHESHAPFFERFDDRPQRQIGRKDIGSSRHPFMQRERFGCMGGQDPVDITAIDLACFVGDLYLVLEEDFFEIIRIDAAACSDLLDHFAVVKKEQDISQIKNDGF